MATRRKQYLANTDLIVDGNIILTGEINKGVLNLGKNTQKALPAVTGQQQIMGMIPQTYTGLTATPTVPTLVATGKYMGVILTWDWQTDLSNFLRFEVQTSDDNSTWYDLSTNMTTGLGTAAGVTKTTKTMLIHSLPTSAVTLYYRVRRVNSVSGSDNSSAWSTVASATTLTSSDGDLVSQAIFAQAVYAGDVIFSGKVASQTNKIPADGDVRSYLTKGAIEIDKYSSGVSAWQNLFFG